MTADDPNAQTYYAHRSTRGTGSEVKVVYLHASPNRRWLDFFYSSDPIVRVSVRERIKSDPPSKYWGWLRSKHPGAYTNVWPSEVQLEMCWPNGTAWPTQQGEGRKVNLIVEELP